MAIKSLEQRKRQKTLLFVGLGIVLATAAVLYFGFWKTTPVPEEQFTPGTTGIMGTVETTPKVSMATEEKLKKINLDFKFLNEKIIPFLKIHGNIPVEVDKDKVGRDNPFIPY
jgi:hypothetical protein